MSMPPEMMESALMAPPAAPQSAPPEEGEEAGLDYEVAVGLILKVLYKDKMMEQVAEALKSGSFADAAAAMVVDMTVKVREQMLTRDLVEDGRIWAANGGVMHSIADEMADIGQTLGIEEAFDEAAPDAIFQKAVEMLQQSEGGGASGVPPEGQMPPPEPPSASQPPSALGV